MANTLSVADPHLFPIEVMLFPHGLIHLCRVLEMSNTAYMTVTLVYNYIVMSRRGGAKTSHIHNRLLSVSFSCSEHMTELLL